MKGFADGMDRESVARIAVLIAVASWGLTSGCATTRGTPSAEVRREATILAEEDLRDIQREVLRLTTLDRRYGVRIPAVSFKGASIETALDVLTEKWKAQLGKDDIPPVIRVDCSKAHSAGAGEDPSGKPTVTCDLRDVPVAAVLVYLAHISPYDLVFVGGVPVLEDGEWSLDRGKVAFIPVSKQGQAFLGLAADTTQDALMAKLMGYGIQFQGGYEFKACWEPRFEKVVIVNYPEEIGRLKAILGLIDRGYVIEKKTVEQ